VLRARHRRTRDDNATRVYAITYLSDRVSRTDSGTRGAAYSVRQRLRRGRYVTAAFNTTTVASTNESDRTSLEYRNRSRYCLVVIASCRPSGNDATVIVYFVLLDPVSVGVSTTAPPRVRGARQSS